MFKKICSLLLILVFSLSVSNAADTRSENSNEKTQKTLTVKELVDQNQNIQKPLKVNKISALKKFVKKCKRKFVEKFWNKKRVFPQRILILMIIGMLFLLPGIILAAIGVALIFAIIFALIGGALMIAGLLLG